MRYTTKAQKLLAEMEIIHCHHLFMSMEMAHRYFGRCPIVYAITRYDLYRNCVALPQPAADAVMRQVWPEVTDQADVVITPSESVRQIMLDFWRASAYQVIENGVDLRPFHQTVFPHSPARTGYPGGCNCAYLRGPIVIRKKSARFARSVCNCARHCARTPPGFSRKGAQQSDLAEQARHLSVSRHVHFAGAIAYDTIPRYLTAADLFVTASVTEVHPLTIIEAMAAGLPVAAPAAPGIVDTVELGVSGLLTENPERGLAAAMVGLALNETRRKQMGEAARQASERFDIRRTVSQTVALYEHLREERPDLRREKAHGRWAKNRERWQPMLEQLVNLVRPQEDSPLQWLWPEKEGDSRER
ncbi:MAG: glycosyltransferase [Ardenticatenaceae bacterium]|nr:glycosyltransferase [Ardenticatenaceae bacterium]